MLLAAAYTFLIPVIRGSSNLDAVRSADVFGQSLTLIGVFLFVPITSQELESGIKEIVYTKVWSYKKECKYSADMRFSAEYGYSYNIRWYHAI